MSFSISVIGSPTAVKQALSKYSDALTGISKKEFDAILPALGSLLDQHVDVTHGCAPVWLTASGHATIEQSTNTRLFGTCDVNVRPLNAKVVYEDVPLSTSPSTDDDDDIPF